jgi:hypothetical protein
MSTAEQVAAGPATQSAGLAGPFAPSADTSGRLVEQIGNRREPAALLGWPATTAKRECLRIIRVT